MFDEAELKFLLTIIQKYKDSNKMDSSKIEDKVKEVLKAVQQQQARHELSMMDHDELMRYALQGYEAVQNPRMTNTEILMFVLGWQGGTIHQVEKVLGVPSREILEADRELMEDLCRMAQRVRAEKKNEPGRL